MLWTALAALFAWFGFNRLEAARETGRFEYLWHGIGQDEWPLLFNILKVALTIWTGMACFLALMGFLVLARALWKKSG